MGPGPSRCEAALSIEQRPIRWRIHFRGGAIASTGALAVGETLSGTPQLTEGAERDEVEPIRRQRRPDRGEFSKLSPWSWNR